MTAGTQPFQIKLSSLLIWGLGLFWMLAMLSADFRDPTFFNPLYPAEGLHNWLSLPGALLGGSMIEIFGPVALLIPWLFVRIIIPPSGSAARWLLIYHALILLITSSTDTWEKFLRHGWKLTWGLRVDFYFQEFSSPIVEFT